MNKGISLQGFVPIRKEPSEASEMVSQVLFGEMFQIMEHNGIWLQISLDFDGSEGWIEKSSIQPIKVENGAENESQNQFRIVSAPSTLVQDRKQGNQLRLPAGSIWSETTGKSITILGKAYNISSQEDWIVPDQTLDPESIGKQWLSIPHLKGGRCGFGFDSSGLVQTICRMMGLSLPRDCRKQSELGRVLNFLHEMKKSDLAFFDNEEGEITHVGMVMDGGRILHVHDRVRIDKLDQQGIYCAEREAYTHKLRVVKRVIGDR